MITPKKSLGQNWLRSETALSATAKAAQLQSTDTVLEIGPGTGKLTELLLASNIAKLIAIEKDRRLIGLLAEQFKDEIAANRLELIEGDALTFDHPILKTGRWKLVANLPYYITGQAFRHFLWEVPPPATAVLMLQKEVAKRILASDGKESLLSISIKAAGEPAYIKTVPAGAFFPPPKVDSAIVAVYHIKPLSERGADPNRFFEVLHRGFAHKRKLLANNLACSTTILEHCKINPLARAENLSLDQWLCLSKQLPNHPIQI